MSTRRGLTGGNRVRQGFTRESVGALREKALARYREQQRTEAHRPKGGWSGRGLTRAALQKPRTRVKL
jgi:hypothetical protein